MSQSPHHPKVRKLAFLIASWGGCGRLPKAPGTWGSLAALPFAWALSSLGGPFLLLLASVGLFVIGVWAADTYTAHLGEKDPPEVVVDEVVGQWVTLLLTEPNLLIYGLGFVLFRLFDIVKPWPVSWADRRLKGGLGIMLDDVLAGLYAAVALIGLALVLARMIG